MSKNKGKRIKSLDKTATAPGIQDKAASGTIFKNESEIRRNY